MELKEIINNLNLMINTEGNIKDIERLIISEDELLFVKDKQVIQVNEYPKEYPYKRDNNCIIEKSFIIPITEGVMVADYINRLIFKYPDDNKNCESIGLVTKAKIINDKQIEILVKIEKVYSDGIIIVMRTIQDNKIKDIELYWKSKYDMK